MSDWNTLHYFDDKIFYSEIVPDFKDRGILLKHYFNSQLGNRILWDNSNSEERNNNILNFCKHFDNDFKTNKRLHDITIRQKKDTEPYADFISKYHHDQDEFIQANINTIEDFNRIFTLIIFSECAAFNPHLILGRKIFTGSVSAKPNSVSDEIISNLTNRQSGSIYSIHGNGLINWVTCQDLRLLLLDKENLFSTDNNAQKYFGEFIKFIEIAVDNNWGCVSGTNMNETILKMIDIPKVKIDLDLVEMGFQSVINY